MKLLTKLLLTATVALTTSVTSAQAADSDVIVGQLQNVSGNVLVERSGQVFRTATGSGIVAGDRVVAIDGASANIELFSGCKSAVDASSSVVIGTATACDAVFETTSVNIGDTASNADLASMNLEGEDSLLLIGGAAGVIGSYLIFDHNPAPTSP